MQETKVHVRPMGEKSTTKESSKQESTTKNTAAQGQEAKNLPVKRFRAGAISATVWENQAVTKNGEIATFYTVSLDRSYKDESGEWQHTASYRINDLPRAKLVLEKAYEWVALEN